METQVYSTWLEIDLDAIRHNIRAIKQMTHTTVMAVIKANGYGHGALQVARAAIEAGADWCGVARIEEAITLREQGIKSEIMVLGYTPPALVPEAIRQDIHVAIYDPQMAAAYLDYARQAPGRLKAHVKVETGMGRLGMVPEKAAAFLADYHDHEKLDIDGIFTHFARADEPDLETTQDQLSRFIELLDQLREQDLLPEMVHTSNSAAIINFPQTYFDMVRPGIALYGLNPSPDSPVPADFRPALTWKARLTSLRVLPPGHGVSYGHKYTTQTNERIGVIPVGYGDGYRRVPGQQALVRGQRVNVVGRVCMDQCMLQLDSVPEAQVGDEVVLLGKQGKHQITADDLAETWGTLNYEVVCGLADRLPRIYLNA
jgi:alanine racemase